MLERTGAPPRLRSPFPVARALANPLHDALPIPSVPRLHMSIDLSDLRALRITELVQTARELGVDNAAGMKKQELIFEIVRRKAGPSGGSRGEGVLETLPDGFGFLRSPACNYLPGPDDIYVSPSQIRRFNLRTGDLVGGRVRAPKEGERYFALIKIETVNDRSPDTERQKLLFDNLSPVQPARRIPLAGDDPSLRLIQRFLPFAHGQRIAVHAPPRAGRSTLVRELANGIAGANPDAAVLVVLVDERPEEVSAMAQAVRGEVLSSTFDEPPSRHVQVSEMALERAKRLVEQGRDVFLFIDSLSRLARAYNATAAIGGRELNGGVDLASIQKGRRLFGAGRCLDEGGSLTLVATLLTRTEHAVDELLLKEVDGSANAELRLDPDLVDAGIWPAFDLKGSFVRGAERVVGDAMADTLVRELRALPTEPSDAIQAALEAGPVDDAADGGSEGAPAVLTAR